MDKTTLGERLASARAAAGLTREQLAVAAEMAGSTVGAIERGKTSDPGNARVLRLAQELGVSFLWLSTGEGCMQAQERGEA